MFKKIITALIISFCLQSVSFATELSTSINDILSAFNFDRDSVVSISIKDKNTGLGVYEKNSYKYLNPASTLKLFTMAASQDALGKNHSFDTAFYKDKKGDLYLKLSGDPMLTTEDINIIAQNLKKNLKNGFNKIYIDDSVIDKIPYPDGWTIDDYWPNGSKLSPYMVDFNRVNIDFYLDENKSNVRVIQKDAYKFAFVNKLIIADSNNVSFSVDDMHNTVNINGTISSNIVNMPLPVLNPKYFFCQKLDAALNKNGTTFNDKFLFGETPKDAVLVAKFSRPLDDVITYILRTSDNLAAEMVFKVAGGKYAVENSLPRDNKDSLGTTQNGIKMFEAYVEKLGLDGSQIKIRDASGVSRYNVLNTNWMTSALLNINFNCEKYLPTAGAGTLSRRMRELTDCVYMKTGTIYGVSSLVGLIRTGDKEYYWASIIMSYNRNKSMIKGVEDEMVYEVYRVGENE